MRNYPRLFGLATLLLAAALACQVETGGPDAPPATLAVSTEAAANLDEAWTQAFEQAQTTGTATLSLTESQLTSFVALKIAQQEQPVITNPQVLLRDGQIQVYGVATRGVLSANVRIVLTVSVGDAALPIFEITSADFGPVAMPPDLLSGLSSMLAEALTGQVGPAATGFRLESILIQDGLMLITGRVK